MNIYELIDSDRPDMTRLQWVAMESLPPLSCPTRALEDPPSQIGGPWFQGIFHCILWDDGKICTKILGISSYYITWVYVGVSVLSNSIHKALLKLFHQFFFQPWTLFENLFTKDTGRLCKFLAELPDGAKLWSLFPSAPGGSSLISVSILRFRHSLLPNCHQVKTQTFLQILALRIYWTCTVVLLQLRTWRSWQIALWAHAPEALELKRMSFPPVCPWIHFVADLVQVN